MMGHWDPLSRERAARQALVGVGVGLALGCGDPSAQATLDSRCLNAVLGGSPDTSHVNAVALVDQSHALLCGGTILRGHGQRGIVFTAAHCLTPRLTEVVAGEDYRAPSSRHYSVIRQIAHPDFRRATGDDDFGVVVLDGPIDEPSASVLRPEQDDLTEGLEIAIVGYGSRPGEGFTSQRSQWRGRISELTPRTFRYSQAQGGPCTGDSGGPAFATWQGHENVLVGITSFGDPQCTEFGVSGRAASAVSFVDAVLATEPPDCH